MFSGMLACDTPGQAIIVMATSASNQLNCTVCLETFKNPKVLPCLHTFCATCLERIVSGTRTIKSIVVGPSPDKPEGILTCPQCRKKHTIPDGGIRNFLTDFSIANLVLKAGVKKQGEGEVLPCEECDSGEQAIAHCAQCCSYLCEFCSGAHKRLKCYRDHDMTALQDLNLETFPPKHHPQYCLQHPNELLKLYCKSCNILVCCNCIVVTHQGHTFASINRETRNEVEQILKDMSRNAQATLAEFSRNLNYVNEVEKVTTAHTIKLKAEINAVFDRHVTALERHRAKLLEEADSKCNASLKEVWSQKEHVERIVEDASSTLRFTERSQQCESDIEMLSLAAQAIPRLEGMRGIKWDSTAVSQVERKYIFLKEGKYPDTGNMERLEEKDDSLDIKLSDISNVLLGTKKQVNLSVKRKFSQRPVVFKYNPTVSITFFRKSLAAELMRNQAGLWTVTFTPVCSGLHVIRIVFKESKSPVVKQFTVFGKPKVGSHVCKGPHWSYGDISGEEQGIVIANNSQETVGCPLSIAWGRNQYLFRWGEGGYDVQLVL